jgi:hypothetical protein
MDFLVVSSSGNKIVYLPLSRLLRIEVIPAPPGEQFVSAVLVVFEDFQVTVQIGKDTVLEKFAHDLFERLTGPELVDLVYLRSDAEKGINAIRFGQ